MSLSIVKILCCPECFGELERADDVVTCLGCGSEYPADGHQLDLRPRRPVDRTLALTIQPPGDQPATTLPAALPPGPYPPIPYPEDEPLYSAGNRLSPNLTTYAPPARGPDDVLLDLGCGETPVAGRLVAGDRRLAFFGADYQGETPDVLLDAHCLPVRDDSVPVVMAIAVLEHVRVPRLVATEIARVLRPGGYLIGTVAFLEAFHMDSAFHHTHLGLRAVLAEAGLRIVGLESNADWIAPVAIHAMTRAPARTKAGDLARRGFSRSLPLLYGFTRGRLHRNPDLLATVTAGFRFVAQKEHARS